MNRRLEELALALERAADSLAGRVLRRHPIGPLTTYRVGGAAAVFVVVETDAELAAVARTVASSALDDAPVPTFVLGRGSNVLIADSGFDGLVLQLGDGFATVEIEGSTVVAGGAAALPVVARRTAGAGLRGFEWAVGVPGSVGGAVRMNAGGHGSDIAATLRGIRRVDLGTGHDEEVAASDLTLGYRRSALSPDQVVTRAVLELTPGSSAEAEAEIDEVVRWRRANQPGGANAGSVFTNPEGDSAGRLIDLAGCKGMRVGSAEVSTKHANFIQADPGGSADDVAALMARVVEAVWHHSAVRLIPETRLVGFGSGT